MKKFLYEYKALRSKSETETSKGKHHDQDGNKVGSQQDMGVFKWLRRERVTVTHTEVSTPSPEQTQHSKSATKIGTIRTEEYKRDLAEFQARRSIGNKELPDTPIGNIQLPDTPVKKKCGKNSLTVSCTNCATDHDNSFNYDKKSAVKYKRKTHKRTRSATPDETGLPNIQFLFQNQVFMPGNLFQNVPYSEPPKSRHTRNRCERSPEIEFSAQKYIDFNEDQAQSPRDRSPDIKFSAQKHIDFNEDQAQSPPLFYKNNSLPFDVKNFLEIHKSEEEVDGAKAAGDVKSSQETSPGGNESEDRLWEVMSELKNLDKWADEQLQGHNSSKSDDSKSDTSAYGLPIASGSDLDLNMDYSREWSQGRWGVVPVQVKRLPTLTVDFTKGKLCTEINILRKYRHPNIILLMGIYADVRNNVHIICETCVDTLFGVLHVQGRIVTAQTAVQYALDIANALVFLRMQGYLHTEVSSHCVMITAHDAAKLADLGPCERLPRARARKGRGYEVYSPEPQYVNIEDTRESNCADSEPLLSKHPSETYLSSNSVAKPYKTYRGSERYRWHAPELFEEENGVVRPCCRSDVYSLCLVLWESCNAKIPFKSFTYEKLKESYVSWHTGVRLPQDGTYPGCLLALLQEGLALARSDRVDMTSLQSTLQKVKRHLDKLEYIIIPARLTKKKSTFSTNAWDTNSPTDDSECLSPAPGTQHETDVHRQGRVSSTESSEKDCSKSDGSPLYETIQNHRSSRPTFSIPEKCYISDGDYEGNEDIRPMLKYQHLSEKEFSSACSTPVAKIRARIKDIGTPNALHRSDSTEYCSILSPDRRNFGLNDDSNKDSSVERHSAKFSRSFTPKSYKPLHIKVPECNFDSVKSILKEHSGTEKPSYNFDIKNYSLPSTPIARNNKLRKNAWLSGDLSVTRRCSADKLNESNKSVSKQEQKKAQSAPETPADPLYSSTRKEDIDLIPKQLFENEEHSVENAFYRDSSTGLRGVDPPQDFTPEPDENHQERTNSWSFKSSTDRSIKYKVEDEILASVNVKPLVAIHERWIYEANRKTGRSMSLPEDNRCQIPAVKPASHCVDTLQKSLPQLNLKKGVPKPYRPHPASPNGISWEQFCQARDTVARNVNFGSHNSDRFATWKKETSKGTITDIEEHKEPKVDQSTDTRSIEEFIRDLIRKEFQHLVHEIDDATISTVSRNEEILNKGVSNIVENLRSCDDSETVKKEQIKSFSRVKINGNNKPLLQITFTRSGENSLQVLDNCVKVTICDALTGTREKANVSLEETLTGDDGHAQALKRCQAFSALQEARSTEDLYIDDDLSAQMQENFGGKVKLIPLHGSLHEILCEKEDECCLIKVKQENGCDTIYFRCDNSDTESRDAIDGASSDMSQDTVVFKRSISLVEERIQRIFPKEKRPVTPVVRRRKKTQDPLAPRPKSEVFIKTISDESRALSSSSPSLIMKGDTIKNEAIEVNIENVMSYQDSSSDECIKCHVDNDDFEILEKEIEDDLANSVVSNLTCGCLAKISEENLSVLNEDVTLKEENFI